jgi:hypothetical protein
VGAVGLLTLLAVLLVGTAVFPLPPSRHQRGAVLGGPLLTSHVPIGMEVVGVERGPTDLRPDPGSARRHVEVFAPTRGGPEFVVTSVDQPDAEQRLRALGQRRDGVERVEVGGRPGVHGRLGLIPPVGSTQVAWAVGPDVLAVVASETASGDELLAVAGGVELGGDGRPVLAGGPDGLVRVGGIGPATFGRQSEVTTAFASVDGGADRAVISVLRVTPAEERAFVALMAGDPTATWREEPECCEPSTGLDPYELDVDGRPGTIGTVGPTTRALVVGADAGIVVLTDARAGTRIFADKELFFLTFYLEPVTSDEADATVARYEGRTSAAQRLQRPRKRAATGE